MLVPVAQLVRASDCDSEGRGFESHRAPQLGSLIVCLRVSARVMSPCVFCEIPEKSWVHSTEHLFVIRDRHPVTPRHLLIIPKVHRRDLFDLSDQEFFELPKLLQHLKSIVSKEDSTVSGFNVGANSGEAAGQTVFHCHIHFIPRRAKDVKNPRGGVRGVIPSKQNY